MINIDYEQEYIQDVNMYNSILHRYNLIQENDIAEAYRLMKYSLQAYNRWSKIRHDVRQASSRGQNAETKERLKEMCEILSEIHVDMRVLYGNARNDMRNKREE